MLRMSILISGAEGSGKDAIIRRVRHLLPWMKLGAKATTRDPRADDWDVLTGVSKYEYLSVEEFMRLRRLGVIVEHSQNATGGLYGAMMDFAGADYEIRDLDVNGALQLMGKSALSANFPHVIPIGILPPYRSHPDILDGPDGLLGLFRGYPARDGMRDVLIAEMQDVITQRLESRGDTPQAIKQKLARSEWEIPEILRSWPHVVINDELDEAVTQVVEIIQRAIQQDGFTRQNLSH